MYVMYVRSRKWGLYIYIQETVTGRRERRYKILVRGERGPGAGKGKMEERSINGDKQMIKYSKINCCSTNIQVFHRNGSVFRPCTWHYAMLYALWIGTMKIFSLTGSKVIHVTQLRTQCYSWPSLEYIFARFHHSTSSRSWVIVKTDRRTDRQTYRTIIV